MCEVYIILHCFSFFFLFKQKTAYEMRISDWSSDVCSSDLFSFEIRQFLDLGVAARQRLGPKRGRQDIAARVEIAGFGIAAVGMKDQLVADRQVHRPACRPFVGRRAVASDRLEVNGLFGDDKRNPRVQDRKSTSLKSRHLCTTRMPSSA